MPKIVAEYIDRLINLEMRAQGGPPRGVTHQLYEAARKKQGEPLTYLAAKALIDNLEKGSEVIIATGAGVPPWLPKGETDGPLGAAVIARAIDLGFEAKPIITGEKRTLEPTIAACEAAGITIVDEKRFYERSHVALVIPYELGEEAGQSRAKQMLEKFNPKAIITVEKHGPSASGKYHSIMGIGRSPDLVANIKFLVELAQNKGIVTIGIGDGGNEIGFGLIYDEVRKIQKYGSKCQCPCGAGVATVTKTDILVSAAVSNWGAYGVVAMLAFLLKNTRLLQDKEIEYRMLDACVRAGAMDGLYDSQSMYVDGISSQTQLALVTILHEILNNGLMQQPRNW